MKKSEVSRYVMERALREMIDKHWGVVGGLSGMADLVAEWDDNLRSIELARQVQEVSVAGFGELKQKLRNDMTDVMLRVCRRVHSYGVLTGNEPVAATTSYSKRSFVLARDTEVRDIAEVVWKCASDEIENLGNWGVDADLLAAGRAAIDAYESVLSAPRLAVVRRKQATQRIGELIDRNIKLLRRMDLMMEVLRDSDSGLYWHYRNVKRVYVLGRERMALKLQVNDGRNGEGISGVKVAIRVAAGGDVVLSKLTYKGGGAYVQNLADGRYWVDFVKSGYVSLGCAVFVTTGEMRRLVVEMDGGIGG